MQIGLGLIGLAALIATVIYAARSVAVSQQTGQAQVRAYVALKDAKAAIDTSRTSYVHVVFDVENSGNSPAREFNYTFLVTLDFQPIWPHSFKPFLRENSPQYPDFPRNGDRTIRLGEPQHINHAITDFPLTAEEIELLDSGRAAVVLHLTVATRFKDVFDVTVTDAQHFLALFARIKPTSGDNLRNLTPSVLPLHSLLKS